MSSPSPLMSLVVVVVVVDDDDDVVVVVDDPAVSGTSIDPSLES